MAGTLSIQFRPAYWVHPIRAAIAKKPALASADAKWSDPNTRLSDLSFWIETRLGNLPEIVRLVDESLKRIGEELDRNAIAVGELMAGGYVYQAEDESALQGPDFCDAITESRGGLRQC
jgi:hypothetical protein